MERKKEEREGVGLEGLAQYEYGALAGRLLERDPGLASQSLLLLNEELNIDGATRELLDKAVYDNKEGIKKAAEIYSGRYSEIRDSLTVGELLPYYDDILNYLERGEDNTVIKEELEKFSGEKLGDIHEELRKASYLLQGVEERLYDASKKEKDDAKATMKKYGDLMTIFQVLENAKLEQLRPKVVERHTKRNLEALARNITAE